MSYIKMLCDSWKDRDGLEQAIAQAKADPDIGVGERKRVLGMLKGRLSQVKRLGSQVGSKLREFIRDRDQDICRYCGDEEIGRWRGDYAIDHVMPVALGGLTSADNLVMACVPCNGKKGARTLEQAGMVLLPIPENVVRQRPSGRRF